MREEIPTLIASMTFVSDNFDSGLWPLFFKELSDIVESNEDSDRVVAKLLLGLNYKRTDCRELLIKLLANGGDYLVRTTVTILQFLTAEQHLERITLCQHVLRADSHVTLQQLKGVDRPGVDRRFIGNDLP